MNKENEDITQAIGESFGQLQSTLLHIGCDPKLVKYIIRSSKACALVILNVWIEEYGSRYS